MRRLSTIPEYALNAICPYYAMFPLEFPIGILRRLPRDTVVLDPFCGRGTTNYAAQVLGMKSYGVDVSPVAVAIAQAKFAKSDSRAVIRLAREILEEVEPTEIPSGDFWTNAFHPSTLIQICALREGLRGRRVSNSSALLRALALGCLHGPLNKYPETLAYFSNQMPRTFASKPNSAVKYWKNKNLRPPRVDVLDVLRRKAMRSLAYFNEAPNSPRDIRKGDCSTENGLRHVKHDIDFVITSPPYYGLQTYVEDQWLRNWFLGGSEDVPYGRVTGLSQSSQSDFAYSLGKVWYQVSCVASPQARMVVRFGSIPSKSVDPRQILQESISMSGSHWQIYRTLPVAAAPAGKRQATSMGTKTGPVEEYDFFCRLD